MDPEPPEPLVEPEPFEPLDPEPLDPEPLDPDVDESDPDEPLVLPAGEPSLPAAAFPVSFGVRAVPEPLRLSVR